MIQQSFTFRQNIAIQFDATNLNTIVSIVPPFLSPSVLNKEISELVINRSIKNCNLEVFLFDLGLTPFPEELTSELLTDLEKNLLIRNNEWRATQNCYIECLLKPNPQASWLSIGACVALNRDSTPYSLPGFSRAIKQVDGEILLGQEASVGVKVSVNGASLSSRDKLIFTGLYEETAILKPFRNQILSCTNHSWLVPTTGLQILPIQENRATFKIANNGNERVWLNLDRLNGIGTGDPINPGGFRDYSGYSNYRFSGSIWLISEKGDQPVSAIVCVT